MRRSPEALIGRWHSAGNMVRASDVQWRVWWRRAFGTFLVLALVVGLYLSFRPAGFEEEPQVAEGEQTTEPAVVTEPPDDGGDAEEEPDGQEQADETEEPADDELTEEEIQELIAAARDPEETSVQVLDAGAGGSAADEVAALLRDLGYDVVAVNAAREDRAVTTVLFTEGNRAEAEALRAREQRVTEIAPNELLSDAVDLHVAVGTDWNS